MGTGRKTIQMFLLLKTSGKKTVLFYLKWNSIILSPSLDNSRLYPVIIGNFSIYASALFLALTKHNHVRNCAVTYGHYLKDNRISNNALVGNYIYISKYFSDKKILRAMRFKESDPLRQLFLMWIRRRYSGVLCMSWKCTKNVRYKGYIFRSI